MPKNSAISRNRRDYQHWTKVSLRYSDQDPLNHINNVAITALIESGRVGLFETMLCDTPLETGRIVLANLTIDYLHEITYPGSVDVGGMLAAVGDRSVTTRYAVFQGDVCCVVSQSVNVYFDPVNRRSAPPPPGVREAFERFRSAQSAPNRLAPKL